MLLAVVEKPWKRGWLIWYLLRAQAKWTSFFDRVKCILFVVTSQFNSNIINDSFSRTIAHCCSSITENLFHALSQVWAIVIYYCCFSSSVYSKIRVVLTKSADFISESLKIRYKFPILKCAILEVNNPYRLKRRILWTFSCRGMTLRIRI